MKKRLEIEIKGFIEFDIVSNNEDDIKEISDMFNKIKISMEAGLVKSKGEYMSMKAMSILDEYIIDAEINGDVKEINNEE